MKTVREWLKHFEEMAETDTVYGLQMKNGIGCKFADYKHIKEVREESEPWLDYPVCHIEYKAGDIPYCLIQYQGE